MANVLHPSEKTPVSAQCEKDTRKERFGSPIEALDCEPESAVRKPAINAARTSLWIPLYVAAFLAMVVAFVLLGVSLAIDMFFIDLPTPSYIGANEISAVCDGGCAAVNELNVESLLGLHYFEGPTEAARDVYAQMHPFAVTSCTQQNVTQFNFVVKSSTTKARAEFWINCSARLSSSKFTDYKYVVGFSFYHALGAPRIHRVAYPVQNKVLPVVATLFVFSGLSIVLYAAVLGLRAKVSPSLALKTREQCCVCNAPNHVRRLTAAVISFLVLSVIVAIVHLGMTSSKGVPADKCERCYDDATVTAGYWAVLALILVFHFIALALVCAAFAMRV